MQPRRPGNTIDKALYDRAKEYYEEAFYRCTFVGAENSIGFHNPKGPIDGDLGDLLAFAGKAEARLPGAGPGRGERAAEGRPRACQIRQRQGGCKT